MENGILVKNNFYKLFIFRIIRKQEYNYYIKFV